MSFTPRPYLALYLVALRQSPQKLFTEESSWLCSPLILDLVILLAKPWKQLGSWEGCGIPIVGSFLHTCGLHLHKCISKHIHSKENQCSKSSKSLTNLFFLNCFHNFAFSECHMIGLIPYTAFTHWLLLLNEK